MLHVFFSTLVRNAVGEGCKDESACATFQKLERCTNHTMGGILVGVHLALPDSTRGDGLFR